MKLSIIIVNFNTIVLLQDCLDSLYQNYQKELQSGQFEIIVIDNASSQSVSSNLKKYANLKLIVNKTNVGFAKANNLGIKRSSGEYILLLNPDTIVYADTLTRVLTYINSHPNVGIVTCKVTLPDGSVDDASHRGFPTPWRALMHFSGLGQVFKTSEFFNGYHLGYKDLDKMHEIDACAGAFLMLRRSVGEKVNWLDEDYFWYGDDLDLCYRVKQAGYKIVFIPDVSIMHYKGAASGIKKHSLHVSRASGETKKLATQARFEVMRIFYRKHYQKMYPGWLTRLVFLGINIKQKITEL